MQKRVPCGRHHTLWERHHACPLFQADFANKYIGGGVIVGGCVQEEIRFAINPELTASLLFCAFMKDDEALILTGTERFCDYKVCAHCDGRRCQTCEQCDCDLLPLETARRGHCGVARAMRSSYSLVGLTLIKLHA